MISESAQLLVGLGALLAITAVIFTGMHVALGLLGLGLIGIHFLLPRTIIGDAAYQAWIAIDNSTLAAVVLYVLMGELIQRSPLGERAFSSLEKLLSGVPGGLLHSSVGLGGIFAAVSGSSLASAALISKVAIPPMRQRGYNPSMMYGAVGGGGTLGILIPPSIIMVIYGYLGNVSIGDLFIAGVVPGIVLILAFSFYIWIRVKLRPQLAPEQLSGPKIWERVVSLADLLPLLSIGGIVILGIYAGVWTPTEAAAAGCLATLAVSAAMRSLSWQAIIGSLHSTLITASAILMILVGSMTIAYVINFLHIPNSLLLFVSNTNLTPFQLLMICCIIFVIMGCFVDGLSITVITVPIILPIMTSVGFDPVWFGVIFVILIEISLITPPLGMNLFIIKGVIEGSRFMDIVKGCVPYVLILLGMIVILYLIPGVALWLPENLP
jgi:C4-dicarboxylate transporter, DctM subunit